MGVIGAGPEPDRSCKCLGPECVTRASVAIPCSNEMDAEDLLCPFCREHKDINHCHVFSKVCPVWITSMVPGDDPMFRDKEYHLPSAYADDYLEHILKYAERRYGQWRYGQ